MGRVRRLITIKGVVQGVGFRPFVYKTAIKNNISGWVKNTCKGVLIDGEGREEDIRTFIKDLKETAPVVSVIKNMVVEEKPILNHKNFIINLSNEDEEIEAIIPTDIALCKDCIRDIECQEKTSRKNYSFTNCTNCGPRFTIIKGLPYDRKNTTMNKFQLCSSCNNEYNNPLDRRFHAEPVCCNNCGPSIELRDSQGNIVETEEELVIKKVVDYINCGKIIAVKGLGGFNLICNGNDEITIDRLRKLKGRKIKPLALMMRDIDTVLKYCDVNEVERTVLEGSKKPILLLKKKRSWSGYSIPKNVAYNSPNVGVVLPYTPIHYMLFKMGLEVIVFTSGNKSGSPMIYENLQAIKELCGIADFFITHNRDINMPIDDAVVSVILGSERVLRLGRGYGPLYTEFPCERGIVAQGAMMKNTVSICNDKYIITSPYIGAMDNVDALINCRKNMEFLKNIYHVDEKYYISDMHPNFNDFKYVRNKEFKGEEFKFYHHHSHIISCLVENGQWEENVIGIAFDGTGYGEDGAIWGGEFLVCSVKSFKRVAHLSYMNMPGGEAAVKNPTIMLFGIIYSIYGQDKSLDVIKNLGLSIYEFERTKKLIDNKINTPLTSSMGRLFDIIAALLGFKGDISYEGEPAVYLENLSWNYIEEFEKENQVICDESYEFSIHENNIINIDDMIKEIVEDVLNNMPCKYISYKFHNTIAEIVVTMCLTMKREYNLNKVALSGGVFQNEMLFTKVYRKLKDHGFIVLTHKIVPCNDEGISIGQAALGSIKVKELKGCV